jgi:hypothetical protein
MSAITRMLDAIRHKEARAGHGLLEVECVTRRADGTVTSRETSQRAVNVTLNHEGQVTKMEDIVVRPKPVLSSLMPLLSLVYVVDDGLEYLARYINQSTYGGFTCMALDGDTTVEAAVTTELTAEITTLGGARATATASYEAPYKAVWVHTWTFSGDLTIYGCGIFNQLTISGSKMLMCHLFSVAKAVADTETLQLTMKLTMSR